MVIIDSMHLINLHFWTYLKVAENSFQYFPLFLQSLKKFYEGGSEPP